MRGLPLLVGTGGALVVGLAAGSGDARAQVMDEAIHTFVAADELEYAPGAAEGFLRYDGKSWIGGDYTRIWFKAEGEHSTEGAGGETELQALYSRLIAPFWELQAGVRVDALYGEAGDDARALLAVGLEGLAPWWFEVEPFAFVSQDGDVSARLEASYELLLTQRLIAEPRVEIDAAFQDVPEFGIRSGLNGTELELRLRYEVVRELAPYVGVSWARLAGRTADLARERGKPVSDASWVVGLRMWY